MSDSPQPCSSDEARQFDFWLGEWDLTWPAEHAGGEAGTTLTGDNRITKVLRDVTIRAHFTHVHSSFHMHRVVA